MPITEKWMEMNSTPANIYQRHVYLLNIVLRAELNEKAESELETKISGKLFRVQTACNLFYKYLVEMACVFKLSDWENLNVVSQAGLCIT